MLEAKKCDGAEILNRLGHKMLEMLEAQEQLVDRLFQAGSLSGPQPIQLGKLVEHGIARLRASPPLSALVRHAAEGARRLVLGNLHAVVTAAADCLIDSPIARTRELEVLEGQIARSLGLLKELEHDETEARTVSEPAASVAATGAAGEMQTD